MHGVEADAIRKKVDLVLSSRLRRTSLSKQVSARWRPPLQRTDFIILSRDINLDAVETRND
ncbi:MAG: hypothetical protein CTY36_15895, partial [Methylocystis sp.]